MPLKKVDRLVRNLWYTKTGLRFILWPLSLIFKSIIILRKAAYQIGIKKVTRFNCPVIVVGNITVGGTGKTPLILALAHFLTEKGLHPGIITRGYKGRVKKPELMFADSDPHHVGDEALLLARRSNCPVVVCPDRVAAANYLLQKTKCNVILSDDGLQHFALGRKIEIAVIDGTLGFGNGMLLPAGPLREPPSRLKTVDFCVVCQPENTSHLSSPSPLAQGQVSGKGVGGEGTLNLPSPTCGKGVGGEGTLNLPSPTCGRGVGGEGFNAGTNIIHTMHFGFHELVNMKHKHSVNLNTLQGTIHAVAGIGNPSRFFDLLRMQGLSIIEHAFPDHHAFMQEDFNFLKPDEWVIMTEKDAVKCEVFADERYWYLPIDAKLSDDFFNAVFNLL